MGRTWWVLALIILIFVALYGCASQPQVTLDYGSACLAYADTKAVVAVTELQFVDLCAKGKLSTRACGTLDKARDRLQQAEKYVRELLKNPKVPVDWDKINAYLMEALGIAIKLAPLAL